MKAAEFKNQYRQFTLEELDSAQAVQGMANDILMRVAANLSDLQNELEPDQVAKLNQIKSYIFDAQEYLKANLK